VKCNNPDLAIITIEKAKTILNWEREEDYNEFSEFWQCKKCFQVYWEGKTFKNAQKRFKTLLKDDTGAPQTENPSENKGGMDLESEKKIHN
jgi:uncharacterized protein with PIN domain